jgi:hypothetical protein
MGYEPAATTTPATVDISVAGTSVNEAAAGMTSVDILATSTTAGDSVTWLPVAGSAAHAANTRARMLIINNALIFFDIVFLLIYFFVKAIITGLPIFPKTLRAGDIFKYQFIKIGD